MTGPAPGDAAAGDDGWAAAVPEICIGAALVAVATFAGYALAGLAGTAIAIASSAVAVLVVMRLITPVPGAADPEHPFVLRGAGPEGSPVSFTGYWRRRAGLAGGIASLPAYDGELRGTLQRLLAARLAERHGVSLEGDPEAARRLLCPLPGDQELWYWIDPARPRVTPGQHGAGEQPGIPRRVLARLIDRLEQL